MRAPDHRSPSRVRCSLRPPAGGNGEDSTLFRARPTACACSRTRRGAGPPASSSQVSAAALPCCAITGILTAVFGAAVLLRADLARCAEEAVQEAESVAGRPLPIEFDVEEPPGEAGAVAATGRGRLQQWEEPWVRRVLRGRGSAERRRGEGHLPHLHLSLSRPCALEGADISAFAGAVGAALRGCARCEGEASTSPFVA